VLRSDGKREISTDLYIGVPFERVQMDVLGLFLTTFSRNRYLLVVVDYKMRGFSFEKHSSKNYRRNLLESSHLEPWSSFGNSYRSEEKLRVQDFVGIITTTWDQKDKNVCSTSSVGWSSRTPTSNDPELFSQVFS